MTTPLYRSRPSGFDIQPARGPARQLNEFIYVSEGLSNAFLISTREGRVIVNTGMGFEAPIHKRNFDAVDSSPTRYILLTQGHVDHVGGVDLLKDADTQVIAQAGNQEHQAYDARLFQFRARRSGFAFAEAIMKATQYIRDNFAGTVSPQSRPVPDITFDDSHAFELGGVRFELYATPGGETFDSMVVWLPDTRVCFAGNLFSALFGHFPNLVTLRGDRYRDALSFVASLQRVRDLKPELLLVGHHDPIEGSALIDAELVRLRDAVMYVHDQTVAGMNAGKDVHTLMADITLPPELEVGQGYGKVSWCVRAIWEHYAGWFHARSATELYPVAPSEVSADLVELSGGAAALAERAASRLEAKEPVHAIHLCDIALNADPECEQARTVSLAAHERLESESENFWLTQFLRKQIATLRAGLK